MKIQNRIHLINYLKIEGKEERWFGKKAYECTCRCVVDWRTGKLSWDQSQNTKRCRTAVLPFKMTELLINKKNIKSFHLFILHENNMPVSFFTICIVLPKKMQIWLQFFYFLKKKNLVVTIGIRTFFSTDSTNFK